MKYQHRFQVNASLNEVANFHSRSSSMAAITPPPVMLQIHQAPDELDEGDEMDFTLCLGPLPIHWLAKIEHVKATGFTDRQVRGPFRRWVHRHTYEPIAEATTMVIDEIELNLQVHPLWGIVGLGMWLSLPLLFAFRGWRTRQLLSANHLKQELMENENVR